MGNQLTIAQHLAAIEAADRNRAEELAEIDAMDFAQLCDYVIFSGQGLTLDQMRQRASQWEGFFAIRELILNFPQVTDHLKSLAMDEIVSTFDTGDAFQRRAINRLADTIGDRDGDAFHRRATRQLESAKTFFRR